MALRLIVVCLLHPLQLRSGNDRSVQSRSQNPEVAKPQRDLHPLRRPTTGPEDTKLPRGRRALPRPESFPIRGLHPLPRPTTGPEATKDPKEDDKIYFARIHPTKRASCTSFDLNLSTSPPFPRFWPGRSGPGARSLNLRTKLHRVCVVLVHVAFTVRLRRGTATTWTRRYSAMLSARVVGWWSPVRKTSKMFVVCFPIPSGGGRCAVLQSLYIYTAQTPASWSCSVNPGTRSYCQGIPRAK